MKMRLMLIILILGVCSIVEVTSQEWIRIDGYKKPSGFRSNDIESNDVYQYINMKKQIKKSWDHSDMTKITQEIVEREEDQLYRILSDRSGVIDYDKLDSIGDKVILHADVSEETKRVARQVKRQRPGFFWTIFRVAFETVNETKSAIQQINGILDANILPDTTTAKIPLKKTTTAKVVTPMSTPANLEPTTTPSTTTTKAPFKLTRSGLAALIRKNLQGLVRLFNIEWRDAINQSQISVREFQKNLSKSVQPFLADNPAVY